MIQLDMRDSTAILRLDHGKVNAIDLEFFDAIAEKLKEIDTPDVRAVVITGNARAFSAGVNLVRLLEGGVEYARTFVPLLSRVLLQLFSYPKPVVAAVNGHAIAGGCIIACCADYRVAGAGNWRMGVPEVKVGVMFPTVPLEFVRFVVPAHHLQEVTLCGRTYAPEEALKRGLLDEVVPMETLEARALAVAAELASMPAAVFAMTKKQIRWPIQEMIRQRETIVDEEVVEYWTSTACQAAIRTYLQSLK